MVAGSSHKSTVQMYAIYFNRATLRVLFFKKNERAILADGPPGKVA